MILKNGSPTVCIVTPRVSGMGGAQLYALRRVQFLKEKGIRALLLVSDHSNFMLQDKFHNVTILVHTELSKPVFCYSYARLKEIIETIYRELQSYQHNVIIESHTLRLSIWGELLAERSKGKHLIYPLNETPVNYWEFRPIKKFFIWKQDRIELVGASKPSLKIILGHYYLENKAVYSNIGYDPSEIPSISNPEILSLFNTDSFKIGTISRLSKPYVEVLIQEVRWIAENNPSFRFTLIVAGDDPDARILSKLKRKYPSTHNLSIVFPGYLNPLGQDFFQGLNVYIGMATSVINCAALKCAAITVDPLTKLSAGFFGLTSVDTMFALKNELHPIRYWLQKAIGNKSLIEEARIAGHRLFQNEYHIERCMTLIQDYIKQPSISEDYFSFNEDYLSSKVLKGYFVVQNSKLNSRIREYIGLLFSREKMRSIFT